MASIDIPDEEVVNLFSARIMEALSAESREKLITEGLRFLMTPDKSPYGSKTTPLQDAFDRALRRLANTLADEIVAETGVKDQLQSKMRQFLSEIDDLDTDWELQTTIFRAVIQHVRKRND